MSLVRHPELTPTAGQPNMSYNQVIDDTGTGYSHSQPLADPHSHFGLGSFTLLLLETSAAERSIH